MHKSYANQCPECKGENSPLWCQFASGDFSYRLSDDFLISALCEPGQCPECEGENPPFWCQFATGGIETKLDVFHAAFAIPVNGDIFPLGIPIWWEYVGIFANPEWHQEQELKLPATLEEVNEIVEEFKSIYYAADYFSRTGLRNPIPASAEPDVEPIMPGIESPDPDVDPVMPGILVASSDEFVQLQESIGNLTLLSLEDYRPQILVHGAYMNANTQKRSQALDFVYTLASEEAQYLLFEKTGHLPAHGEVLAEIDGSVARNLVQFGKNGRLAVLPSEN